MSLTSLTASLCKDALSYKSRDWNCYLDWICSSVLATNTAYGRLFPSITSKQAHHLLPIFFLGFGAKQKRVKSEYLIHQVDRSITEIKPKCYCNSAGCVSRLLFTITLCKSCKSSKSLLWYFPPPSGQIIIQAVLNGITSDHV